MFRELSNKINGYIMENYPLFYNGKFSKDIYICGGIIRDLMVDKNPKDVDFFIIDGQKDIDSFIARNHLTATKNTFGGAKITYDNEEVDFSSIKTTEQLVMYNVDGLFFNLNTCKFILQGFENLPQDKKVVLLNEENAHPSSLRRLERKLKVEDFVKTLKERDMFEEIAKGIENEPENFEPIPEPIQVSEVEVERPKDNYDYDYTGVTSEDSYMDFTSDDNDDYLGFD